MNINLDRAVSFSSVPQMRVAVTNSGSHFFDRAAVRFFNSKVESPIIASHFFITSERMEKSDPKRYTIRYFEQTNGEMMCSRELGEFQEFETLAAAKTALRKALNSES